MFVSGMNYGSPNSCRRERAQKPLQRWESRGQNESLDFQSHKCSSHLEYFGNKMGAPFLIHDLKSGSLVDKKKRKIF